MKAQVRIAAGRQYEYTEYEIEGTLEEVRALESRIRKSYEENTGLDVKEFNKILDEYLSTGKVVNGGDVWELFNDSQRLVVNEIKKSINRRK